MPSCSQHSSIRSVFSVWELVALSRKHANVARIWSVGRLWRCRDASGGWIMHIFALGVYQLRKVGHHSRSSIPAKFPSHLSKCIVLVP